MENEHSLEEELEHLDQDFNNISRQIQDLEGELKKPQTPKNEEAILHEIEVLQRRKDKVWEQIVNRQVFN